MKLAQKIRLGCLPEYTVSWENLPENYPLPEEPVDNTDQPLLANALREALELVCFITFSMLIASNVGICTKVNSKTVLKAPDWFFVPQVVPKSGTRRSYTPKLEGEIPALVMEFLSETDGGEYSLRPTYPYGKWWFYERILQVPVYVIFEPESALLQVYHLINGEYQLQSADANGRYWLECMQLYLGVWTGTKAERTGNWLRWWDKSGQLLLWGTEQLRQERLAREAAQQQAEQERLAREAAQQQAAQERQRAERLAEKLRQLGIAPE